MLRGDVDELLIGGAEVTAVVAGALDYGRPFSNTRDFFEESARRASLYLRACEAGDRRSCRLAYVIAPRASEASPRALEALRAHCLANDLMSCRALPLISDPSSDDRLPGWRGRAGGVRPEDIAPLQRECAAGFPRSCWTLDREPNPSIEAIYEAGCRAGVMEECFHIEAAPARTVAKEQLCAYLRRGCDEVHDPDPKRDHALLEFECQYGTLAACHDLSARYERGSLKEPVKGRGRALKEWVAKQVVGPSFEER